MIIRIRADLEATIIIAAAIRRTFIPMASAPMLEQALTLSQAETGAVPLLPEGRPWKLQPKLWRLQLLQQAGSRL